MKPAFALRLFCLVAALVLPLLAGRIALAHVSSDDMPDSVAEVEYAIFLEFQPNDKVVRNKLGMVYYRLNKLEEAVREFTHVLKLDPENYDALDGMGLVKAARQDYDAAISYHRQVIAINPEDMMGYFHLGSALEKKGLRREALEAYHASRAKYDAQYPPGSGNQKSAEFGETLSKAIRNLEAGQ
ncbi:MAG: tetratricopeptide repeat protein [Desulfobulbaceae bacterium]